jgi:NAD(P)-dependent dehydrogenase (short-subunit alcohol dehydrogenase family)
MKLINKTIYVSGASRRIGRTIALAIAREGGDLIIHYNQSQKDAESLKNEIEGLGQKARIVQADFADPESTQLHAEKVFQDGSIYGLINNASVFSDLDWSETNLDSWQNNISVNLTAPFLLCQAFAKSLNENSFGRIINLLDWRSFRPGIDHLPYTISKSGLLALTKSLAVSFAPGLTVNGIALGAILPPHDGNKLNESVDNLPIPRWANLEEVEDTVLFLLSGPGYITGEVIHLDGGRHLI